MLKLMKYELRKNRTLLLTILGIIAALEAYFLISARITAGYTLRGVFSDAATRAEINLAVSMGLLAAASFGTALAIFVMGVAGYSRELNQKTSYLVFMTPNSTLAMVGSKLLFTLFIVAFASPDFQFNYKAFSRIIYNHIHSAFIAGLGFYIIISGAINNRF